MNWIDEIIEQVKPFTLTSAERITALCAAVEYVVRKKIPGDIVECGVWRGGSMMAAALTLLRFEDTSRELFLFDTFDGMTPAEDVDKKTKTGEPAADIMKKHERGPHGIWCVCPLEEASRNISSVNYPPEKIIFVKGAVEETVPKHAPAKIALLRLDTDWHSSTRHELVHLYPRLAHGGVLIVDDYGHWDGARKAVDEYFTDDNAILLNRIDYTGRLAVKVNQ